MPAKHEFAVGEFARSIESGWVGQIIAFDGYAESGSQMPKMMGVDWLVQTVLASSAEEALTPDDIQWFDTNDLMPYSSVNHG